MINAGLTMINGDKCWFEHQNKDLPPWIMVAMGVWKFEYTIQIAMLIGKITINDDKLE